MKRRTLFVAAGAQVAAFYGGAAGARGLTAWTTHPRTSIAPLSLPELVRKSTIILTGAIIRTEERTIRDGVFEQTAFLQVDAQPEAILMGVPKFTIVTTRQKQTQEVAFSYLYGSMVPSSSEPFYKLGDDGIWFLYDDSDTDAKRYGLRGGYHSVTPEQTFRKRSASEQVKAEVKRFLSNEKEPNNKIRATKEQP